MTHKYLMSHKYLFTIVMAFIEKKRKLIEMNSVSLQQKVTLGALQLNLNSQHNQLLESNCRISTVPVYDNLGYNISRSANMSHNFKHNLKQSYQQWLNLSLEYCYQKATHRCTMLKPLHRQGTSNIIYFPICHSFPTIHIPLSLFSHPKVQK